MTLPTLLLSFTLATLYGAGFHLWRGGGAHRLMLYLLAGWTGFALGQVVGDALGMRMMMMGALNFASATLGSGVALIAAHWLATSETAAEGEK